MRKLVILAAAAALAATAMSGCSSKETAPVKLDAKSATACLITPISASPEGGLALSAQKGLEQAKTTLSLAVRTQTVKDSSEAKLALTKLVGDKCSIIIGVGQSLASALKESAAANPTIAFALIDGEFPASEKNSGKLDNTKSFTFDTAQAAYLAGYLAAGTTTSGKVATLMGGQIPEGKDAMMAFVGGVGRYNADHGSNITANFDPLKAGASDRAVVADDGAPMRAAVQELLASGSDVIMPVTQSNVVDMAKEIPADNLAASLICFGSDGFASTKDPAVQARIMTSVLKNADVAVLAAIKSALDGKFNADPWVGSLANKGVDLASLHSFDKRLPADLKQQMQTLRADIIAGRVRVIAQAKTS